MNPEKIRPWEATELKTGFIRNLIWKQINYIFMHVLYITIVHLYGYILLNFYILLLYITILPYDVQDTAYIKTLSIDEFLNSVNGQWPLLWVLMKICLSCEHRAIACSSKATYPQMLRVLLRKFTPSLQEKDILQMKNNELLHKSLCL